MNINNMKALDYTKTKASPNFVKIKMEVNDGVKKYKDNIDYTKIFTPEYKRMKDARNIMTNRELNYLGFETTIYFQLDIDLKTDEEYNALSKEAHDFLEFCDNHFPYYKSATKKYGKHYILPDLRMFDFWNCMYDFNVNTLSDLNKWKDNKPAKKFEYLKKEFGFIEVLKGLWAYCGIEETIYTPKTPFDIMEDGMKLRSIFTDKFYDRLMKPVYSDEDEPNPFIDEPNNQTFIDEEEPETSINMDAPPSHIDVVDKQDMFEEMIRNIDMKDISEHKSFYRILGCIKCAGKQYTKIIKDIARKSPKARENFDNWFDKYYDSIKGNFDKWIVYTYSKNSNPEKHYEIYCKYHYDNESIYTSEFLANVFLDTNKDNILVVLDKQFQHLPSEIYFYNYVNNIWVNETQGDGDVIKHYIGKDIKHYIKNEYILHKSKTCPDKDENFDGYTEYQDKLKDIKNMKKRIEEPIARNNIYTILRQIVKSNQARHQEFDTNTDLLPFMNCVYNFKTNQFQTFSKEDYIMTKIQYDFRAPDKDVEKQFHTFWNSLFKSEAVKQDMTYIVSTCLIAKQYQKLFIFNGEGCNGKSVVQNLIQSMLTDAFYCSAGGNTLTKAISPDKGSPEIAKMNGKRATVFSEPNGTDKFSQETIKQLSGDKAISARMLYSNNTICKLLGTIIAICNVLPQIDGDLDNSILRRIINVEFPFNFTDKKELLEAQPDKYKPINALYTKDEWLDEAKYAMLKMCLEFIKDYKIKYASNKDIEGVEPNDIFIDNYKFCDDVLVSTGHYLDEANSLINWVKEKIVYDPKSRMGLRDLYEELKCSPVWECMDKAQRTALKPNKFYEQICKQPQYSPHYDPQAQCNGKTTRNVLKNHRYRTLDEIEIYHQSKMGIEEIETNEAPQEDDDNEENIKIDVPKKLIRKKNETDEDYNKRCMI